MKIYVMNRYLLYLVVMLFLGTGYKVAGQETGYSLHVNKHYFSAGEPIYFSMYGNSSDTLKAGWPVYFILFKVEKDHQKLIRAIKIHWESGYCSGYLILTENTSSGVYILGVFPYPLTSQMDPVIYAYLYVFNPKEADKALVDAKEESNDETGFALPDDQSNPSNQVSLQYGIEKESSTDSLLTFHGKIITGNQVLIGAKFSVSLLDQRFYDTAQTAFMESRYQPGSLKGSLTFPENKWDSIRSESSYLHGRLMIAQAPSSYQKIYYFYQDDTLLIIDTYITDPEGNFRFREPDIPDLYTLKLLTLPELEKPYRFEFMERLFQDSIYYLNIPEYHPVNMYAFNKYALKKYLIDQSYLNQPVSEEIKKPVRFMTDARPSHTILLDDYISFTTLAEIIREIVPQVSVKYQQGRYEIRIFDAKAKNYCCTGNPLIFINQEPYVDPQELMNLNTADIYSIEVIRPVEAIRSFGDIGLNGILKINLRKGIISPVFESRGKTTFQIPGYQSHKEYQIPEMNAAYPDFRSFLYWNGAMDTGSDGIFEFRFKPSSLSTNFMIVIQGITADGKLFERKMVVETSDVN